MATDLPKPAYASHPTGADASSAFVICAMFTPSYRAKAERLAGTLNALALPFALFEVPHVHRSISMHGAMDMASCKPRFIAAALDMFQRPVAYVDADFEFCSPPTLFSDYSRKPIDFAIYNWLADVMNDAWAPDLSRPERHAGGQARYWRFGFAIEKASDTQVLCTGGVQYWAPTPGARGMLSAWEARIGGSPRTPDDESFDLAFNFSPDLRKGLRPDWLPKEYVRCAYWPYVKPTICHRDIPSLRAPGNFDYLDDARLNAAELTDISKARPYPRGAVVDVVEGRILFNDASGRPVAVPLTLPVYL